MKATLMPPVSSGYGNRFGRARCGSYSCALGRHQRNHVIADHLILILVIPYVIEEIHPCESELFHHQREQIATPVRECERWQRAGDEVTADVRLRMATARSG